MDTDKGKEKQVNIRLAVGIGLFGVGSIIAFYVLFFLMMFLKPGLLFSIMPVPAFTSGAVSDGDRLWLLQQRPDMSTVSFQEKSQPKTIHEMQPVEGTVPGTAVQVPAYDRTVSTGQGLVFLAEGVYRTYTGGRLIEQQNASIGKEPRGAMTPQGLVVLSTLYSVPVLNRVSGSEATAIPLAPEYLAAEQEKSCRCCTRLQWHQGRLYLFWKENKKIAWSSRDDAAWAPVTRTELAEGYDVLSDGSSFYLFNRTGEGPQRQLTVYRLEENSLVEPAVLPVAGAFDDWNVLLVQGKVKLLTRQFMTTTVFTLEKGRLIDPVRIETKFLPSVMLGFGAIMAVAMNGLTVLLVLAVSAVVNRYKRRTGEQKGRVYEFASIFRRFLAHLIDTIVLLLPPALAVAFLVPFDRFPENPFAVMCGMLLVLFSMVVVTFLYFSLLEGLYGKTLGKKLCGIRVLKADFMPCTLGAAFLRNLLRIVDMFFYYLPAVIAMAATMKWQRLGDLAAETVVVREREKK